jgi:tRNA-splicing ligase RtcB
LKQYTWKETRAYLEKQGVELISAGLDEVPWAYKNIREVMDAQRDLARTLATFMPRLVKMAPAGEQPED